MPCPPRRAIPPDLSRPSPSARDATLPVVDPHVLLENAASPSGPAGETLAPLRDYLDRAAGCHLLRAVHVQPDLAWNEALADLARVQRLARTPGSGGLPNGIVARTTLTADDLGARLDALARHPNLRGVRPPADAPLPESLAPLERRDLLLELDAGAVPIAGLVRLARAHPDCRIVLDDTGPPSAIAARRNPRGAAGSGRGRVVPEDPDAPERRLVERRRLGPFENVSLKLGCRDALGRPDARERVAARVARAIEAFGGERVMLASGAPEAGSERPWHEAWHAFADATRGIAASRRDGLFRTNAARIYRL